MQSHDLLKVPAQVLRFLLRPSKTALIDIFDPPDFAAGGAVVITRLAAPESLTPSLNLAESGGRTSCQPKLVDFTQKTTESLLMNPSP